MLHYLHISTKKKMWLVWILVLVCKTLIMVCMVLFLVCKTLVIVGMALLIVYVRLS